MENESGSEQGYVCVLRNINFRVHSIIFCRDIELVHFPWRYQRMESRAKQGKVVICIQIKNLNDEILVGGEPTSIWKILSLQVEGKAFPAPNVINGVAREPQGEKFARDFRRHVPSTFLNDIEYSYLSAFVIICAEL